MCIRGTTFDLRSWSRSFERCNWVAAFFTQLVDDTRGGIQPSSYLLLVTLVALAAIPGLTTVRDSVVQEFGDVAVALDALDQSYTFTLNGTVSAFTDTSELDDPGGPPGEEPAGISVRIAPSLETD